MYNKKGQAAMEFLMTYGWAILAAIIAIGVLAYFGVFSPGRLVGSTGALNAPFNMDAFALVSDDPDAECGGAAGNYDCIKMEITQNAASTIDTFTPTITAKQGISGTPTWACTLTPTIAAATLWTTGEKRTLECHTSATSSWAAGSTISADITLSYELVGSNIAQTSSGSVRGVSQGVS